MTCANVPGKAAKKGKWVNLSGIPKKYEFFLFASLYFLPQVSLKKDRPIVHSLLHRGVDFGWDPSFLVSEFANFQVGHLKFSTIKNPGNWGSGADPGLIVTQAVQLPQLPSRFCPCLPSFGGTPFPSTQPDPKKRCRRVSFFPPEHPLALRVFFFPRTLCSGPQARAEFRGAAAAAARARLRAAEPGGAAEPLADGPGPEALGERGGRSSLLVSCCFLLFFDFFRATRGTVRGEGKVSLFCWDPPTKEKWMCFWEAPPKRRVRMWQNLKKKIPSNKWPPLFTRAFSWKQARKPKSMFWVQILIFIRQIEDGYFGCLAVRNADKKRGVGTVGVHQQVWGGKAAWPPIKGDLFLSSVFLFSTPNLFVQSISQLVVGLVVWILIRTSGSCRG